MDFFINHNSTLPILTMELIQDGRNDFKRFHMQIQNANIFFSMIDTETGIKKISKQPASCQLKPKGNPDELDEYYVIYQFREKDTNKVGSYKAQFTIEFLDDSGTFITPVRDELFIHVR
jgi:hypothetical protein